MDDERLNRQILEKILGSEFELHFATNGKEALDFLANQGSLISLVLLDLIMPVMDGYEALKHMKEDEKLKKIPVIVMTSDTEAEVECFHLGAVDFIPKPYHIPEVVLARVNRSIELSESNTIINATQSDALTGLFNRDYFYEYTNLLDHYNPDTAMDAVAVNIYRFHLVNSMHGRKRGDEVLVALADAIRKLVHAEYGMGCRSDADSFFLYLPHKRTGEEILDALAQGLEGKLDNPKSRLRLGIYENVDRSLEPAQRFDRALIACNTIRENRGTTSIAFYDKEMHNNDVYAEQLMNDIERALEESQFLVFYQPKYDITGEKPVIKSAEALVRWNHPEFGLIFPNEFVPLFENNGLIQKLDHFVWREAAAQIRRWKETFHRLIPVSVNVSRIELLENGFIDTVEGLVKMNGLSPEDLLLELTESAYIENAESIVEIVNELRERGFKVEMDDFGSGYSSLNMLSTLPIDALKLDKGFVKNLHTNEKNRKMVELIMDVAEFLDIPVIAEGVEEEEQYQFLKEAGCDLIQGYYFSPALTTNEFDDLIRKEE